MLSNTVNSILIFTRLKRLPIKEFQKRKKLVESFDKSLFILIIIYLFIYLFYKF